MRHLLLFLLLIPLLGVAQIKSDATKTAKGTDNTAALNAMVKSAEGEWLSIRLNGICPAIPVDTAEIDSLNEDIIMLPINCNQQYKIGDVCQFGKKKYRCVYNCYTVMIQTWIIVKPTNIKNNL